MSPMEYTLQLTHHTHRSTATHSFLNKGFCCRFEVASVRNTFGASNLLKFFTFPLWQRKRLRRNEVKQYLETGKSVLI